MPVIQNTSPEAISSYIHETLRSWSTLEEIEYYFLEALLQAKGRMMPTDDLNPNILRLTHKEVILAGLEELAQKDETGARVLHERFLNSQTIQETSLKLGLNDDHVNQRQRKALNTLSQILFIREKNTRQTWVEKHESQLPPKNYLKLFGLETYQVQLAEKLLDPKEDFTLSLVGMGGLGKTALAHAVTRQIIPAFYFERIIWLRIEPPTLSGLSLSPEVGYASFLTQLAQGLGIAGPLSHMVEQQIKRTLRASPCLIIVDNLEGESDARLIWPALQQLANPSKFLVTSRAHPPKDLDLYSRSMTELSLEDVNRLIKHQAKTLGIHDLSDSSQDTVEAIYRTTGGNPLAIKLVVSLARDLPLAKILGDFTRKKTGRVDAMYRYIYQQTWQVLPPEAQALLQAMPLASESGALPEQIQAMCGLPDEVFWDTLQTLIAYSLLEVLGTPQTRRYGIHGLTRSFLQTDILGGTS